MTIFFFCVRKVSVGSELLLFVTSLLAGLAVRGSRWGPAVPALAPSLPFSSLNPGSGVCAAP